MCIKSRDSIQPSTYPSTKIRAVNLLTSKGLVHKPEASQEFLQYDMDLQGPEGTDFFHFAGWAQDKSLGDPLTQALLFHIDNHRSS